MKITEDELIKKFFDAGYKMYPVPRIENADVLFQKTIYGSDMRKCYFININLYNFEKHQTLQSIGSKAQASVQFFLEDETCFDVDLHGCEKKSIKEIEDFFSDIFMSMSCVPDIHNND